MSYELWVKEKERDEERKGKKNQIVIEKRQIQFSMCNLQMYD